MAKARGRPKLPAKARKGGRLEIRLSESELVRFELAAKRAGKRLSAWLRDAAMKESSET
jgi:hypothetical protein